MQTEQTHLRPGEKCLAEKTLDELGQVLARGMSITALEAFEAVVATSSPTGSAVPPAKKRSKGIVLPQDIDTVLQVYLRLSESFNAANFLSVLNRKTSNPGEGAALLIAQELEECLWRWAAIADSLARGNDVDPSRLAHVWVGVGRMLLQMAHTEAPTPYIVEAARRLLLRVDETTPSQDADLRRVAHALFSCMQFEPQLVQLVASVIGPQDQDASTPQQQAAAREDAPLLEVHPRVRSMVLTLIPSFRNLSERLGLKDLDEPAQVEQARMLEDSSSRQRVLA